MIRRRVDAVLFDLDGTLVDSARDIAASVNWVLSELGLARHSVEEIQRFVGDGMKSLLTRAIGTDDPEHLKASIKLFREHYRAHCLDTSRLYPGVMTVLEALRDKPLAVVTNKPREVSVYMIEQLGLAPHFRVILGGESTPNKKPHPEPILHALQQLGAEPTRSAIVGDHANDILAGKAAGLWTCAVTYGLTDRAILEHTQPDLLLDRLEDLLSHVV